MSPHRLQRLPESVRSRSMREPHHPIELEDVQKRFGQTLVGFARNAGFNVYTGGERVD